jgi:ABC-type transporter Mla subunit MlaD
MLTIQTPRSELPAASAKPQGLAGWSDDQLAQHLGQILDELQRRMEEGRGRRPELEAAMRRASLSLKHLVPSPAELDRPSRSAKTSFTLQEGQRKAVRAALRAGVAPTQVAKHFGLPLSAVRKVLEETA